MIRKFAETKLTTVCRTALVGILLTIALAVGAQPYCNVKTFGVNDGLSASVISGMDQDGNNLMWFSTWNGLSCYDGYQFLTFRGERGDNEVLSSNRLKMIAANTLNDIWVTTYDERLYLFDTDKCHYINVGDIIKQKTGKEIKARKFYSLKNGYTWIRTEQDAISVRIDDRKVKEGEGIEIFGSGGTKQLKGALKKIIFDKKGREWALTTKGPDLIGKNISTNVMFEWAENIGDNTVLFSQDAKAAVYDDKKEDLRFVTLPDDLKRINNITVIDSTAIALATDIGVVVISDNGKKCDIISITTPSQIDKEAKSVFCDNKKRLWAFSEGQGVVMIDTKTGEKQHLTTPDIGFSLTTTTETPFVHQDKNGTVWAALKKGTFSYYDEGQRKLVPYVIRPKNFDSAVQPTIDKYLIDNDGNLWFSSTHDLTLLSMKQHNMKFIQIARNSEVRGLYIWDNGILAGMDNGTAAFIRPDAQISGYLAQNATMQPNPTKLTTKIYSIFEDKKGRLWIGTKGGGLLMTKGRGQQFQCFVPTDDKFSINSKNIYDIFEDNKGNIWVATYGGGLNLVQEGEDGTIKFINAKNRLNGYPLQECFNTRRITMTKEGIILLSTTAGLITFTQEFKNPEDIKFHLYKHTMKDLTSLAADDVLQTLITKKGEIFVATMAGGLQQLVKGNLNGGKLEFKDIPLLSSTTGGIQSMVEDGEGCIWLTRENCLEKYDPQTKDNGIYGIGEISDDIDFSEAKSAYDPKTGVIVTGAMDGIVTFHPKELETDTYTPQIVFTSLQYQGENNIHPVLYNKELDIPADKRNLTIHFAALEYENNRFVKYAYMIEGVDKDWNYTGTQHSASFNKLPHGHLKMLVKSTNADGVWMDNIATLNIYSHPTFWETIWAKLLYLLLIAGAVATGVYIYNLKKRNEMEKEMNEMRTNFFTEVSHKLRTPLTLIGGPVTEVLNKEKLSDTAKEHLQMVQRNTRRMLNLVNKMLEHNKGDNYVVDDKAAPVFASTEDNYEEHATGGEYVEHATEGNGVIGNISDDNIPEYEASTADDDSAESKTSILVVEDNNDLRSFLTSILKEQYRVMAAPNGAEGLKMAKEKMPDFILTDVMMPVMDGMTMVHKIKEDNNICHIPIIILSAKASMEDRLQGLREGVDDYISKPFSATYLKHRIENIIAQRHLLQETMLQQLSTDLQQHAEGEATVSETTEKASASSAVSDAALANAQGSASAGTVSIGAGTASTGKELASTGTASAVSASAEVVQTSAVSTGSASTGTGSASAAPEPAPVKEYRLEQPEIVDSDKLMMEQLMKYIEAHISETELKVDDLAEAVHLGRTVFYGKLKAIVGMSPVDFLRRLRMQRAEYLIANSDEAFSQIAYAVGFSDPKYFSKCFKKETGLTPSEYRAKA